MFMFLYSLYARCVIMRDITTQPRSRPYITALESPNETENKIKADAHGARIEKKKKKNQLGSKRAAYSECHVFLLSNPSDVCASKRASARVERYLGRFKTISASAV